MKFTYGNNLVNFANPDLAKVLNTEPSREKQKEEISNKEEFKTIPLGTPNSATKMRVRSGIFPKEENTLLNYMFPNVDSVLLGNVAKIATLTRTESNSETARITSGISTRTTVELCGLLFDGFSLEEAAEVSIYPQYDSTGGVDSERTFVKQIVQKFCDDGSSDDLFNEEEMAEAAEEA